MNISVKVMLEDKMELSWLRYLISGDGVKTTRGRGISCVESRTWTNYEYHVYIYGVTGDGVAYSNGTGQGQLELKEEEED